MFHRFVSRLAAMRLLLIAVLVQSFVLGGSVAARQNADDVVPITTVDQDGVEIALLGLNTVTLDPDAGTYLTLERVTVAPDTELQHATPDAPVLIAGQTGSFLVTDERGFRAHLDAPFQLVLQPGESPTWTAADEASFLRLSVLEKPPAPVSREGVETEVLASLAMNQTLATSTSLFIAMATLAPDMASTRLDHTATTGLFVETGTVEVLSPSGLEGKLDEGGSIVFPQSTPLDILGTDGTDATALIFGMTDAPEAMSVLQATATDYCRNIERECTAPATQLANGDTWVGPSGRLQLNATTAGLTEWSSGRPMSLELSYTNESDAPIRVSVPAESITVSGVGGGAWTPEKNKDFKVEIVPGKTATMTLVFNPPTESGEDDVIITVPAFGGISNAQWQGHVALSITTPPGSVLAFGETWIADNADWVVSARVPTIDETKATGKRIALDVMWTNTGDEPMEFVLNSNKALRVFSADGTEWSTTWTSRAIKIQPGETRTITMLFVVPQGMDNTGEIVVRVNDFLGAKDATWEGANPLGR